jgi:hypothetical protein
MTLSELSHNLRELADSLEGCTWNHLIDSYETVNSASEMTRKFEWLVKAVATFLHESSWMQYSDQDRDAIRAIEMVIRDKQWDSTQRIQCGILPFDRLQKDLEDLCPTWRSYVWHLR